MHTEITLETPFTDSDQQEASSLNEKIGLLLTSISSLERSLSQDWVRLGKYLHEVRERKFWILWGYKSFGTYIMEIGDKVGKGRSRLYQSIGIVEKLPGVSDSALTEMGISKATELTKITGAGKSVPSELIAKARQSGTTIDEVREDVFKTLNASSSNPGKYWDLGGFYVTPEEREEILAGFDTARRVDPAISHELPEWAQRKEIVLRMVREFRATYEVQVRQGIA